jgi:hypothetical protein
MPSVVLGRKGKVMNKLYLITFDRVPFYVEAVTMREAESIWLEAMRDEWESDWDGNEEPEQISLVYDEPVIRKRDLK